MKQQNISAVTAFAFAATLALAACGGGGGGSDSSSGTNNSSTGAGNTSSATTTTSGNVGTPQFAANSAQLTIFNSLNQYRQQCGFPTVAENTNLDTAAQAHAAYLGLNNVVSDTEDSSKAGYTGTTYSDRATKAGFPQGAFSTGVSAGGIYSNATLTEAEYGTRLLNSWLAGVYHVAVASWPISAVGVGESETTANGFPVAWGSVSMANYQTMTSSGPLTFPCQGTTGVPYATAVGETPTPPNTSGQWGTPVSVTGNNGDTVRLVSGTMTDTSGTVITLQLLDSSNDPNNVLPAFEAVAYPASALQPSTTYTVSLTGTYNGASFSRSFTFTTGSITG
ncbi:SCP domain-containing protein [Paraburkholderia tropica]|uniref:CAP domain-containing protein n=1 Tax=Paraburkholderia tropica TaxID=92647 RepID=UPI001CB3DE06|nr:CAP domain-containing protein [Paraburkholderia tropica]CAG9208332.1 SCP domain-containing protein [Paraburkholderia tropica]